MSTIEERVQAIEREHSELQQEYAELKKTIELQNIAIGALVNKAALERLNEKHDKLFDVLINHDQFTNQQLAELRDQQIEEDGKIVGLQTEMRQRFDATDRRFTEQDEKIVGLDGKVVGLQTEMRQRFNEHDQRFTNIETVLAQILARLPEKP